MLPFWISIAMLSLAQAACVALAASLAPPRLARLRGPRWALVPPLSVIVFVVVVRAAEGAGSRGLTYLALVAVPALAALALGWLMRGARPARALLVPALFALAWADRGGLAGEAAAVTLTACSCLALGALLAAVTPPRWLAAGIVAMAAADTALVASDLLQRPNNALNAAHPAAGLPRLQAAVLGSAVMGYGDLFIAAALGALLAVTAGRRLQLRGAQLTALLALSFDLLFFALSELPATVPVALALIVLAFSRRGQTARRPRAAAARPRASRAPPARTPAAR